MVHDLDGSGLAAATPTQEVERARLAEHKISVELRAHHNRNMVGTMRHFFNNARGYAANNRTRSVHAQNGQSGFRSFYESYHRHSTANNLQRNKAFTLSESAHPLP